MHAPSSNNKAGWIWRTTRFFPKDHLSAEWNIWWILNILIDFGGIFVGYMVGFLRWKCPKILQFNGIFVASGTAGIDVARSPSRRQPVWWLGHARVVRWSWWYLSWISIIFTCVHSVHGEFMWISWTVMLYGEFHLSSSHLDKMAFNWS